MHVCVWSGQRLGCRAQQFMKGFECQARESGFSSIGSGNLEGFNRERMTCLSECFGKTCDLRFESTSRAIDKCLEDSHIVRA